MSAIICPNINTCRMVASTKVIPDGKEKDAYIETWCKNKDGRWNQCTRYNTKATLGFCPDFVLPNTDLSIEEIVDKFEEEN